MKLTNIDLNKLHTFTEVVRHKSCSRAADKLHVTRSAVSQAVSILEETIGIELFHRIGKNLIPNEQGLKLFTYLNEYSVGLEKILNDLKSTQENVEGTLRIGGYLEFTKSKLMPVIEEFLLIYPNVNFKFVFNSPSKLENLLESNKLDLTISIYPHKNSKSIVSKKMYKEELVLIGKSNLVKTPITLSRLLSFSLIDYYEGHNLFERWVYFHYRKKINRFPIKIYAATADMILEFVKRGLGIGIVPAYLVESEKQVNVIQPSNKNLQDYIWLNQLSKGYKSKPHLLFNEWLEKCLFRNGVPAKNVTNYSLPG